MADPPSHEEGDVKIIKPTWNCKNVINTLKMRTDGTEPLLKSKLDAIYQGSHFQTVHLTNYRHKNIALNVYLCFSISRIMKRFAK